MNKDVIRGKCDRIMLEKREWITKILNARMNKVFDKYSESMGDLIDYDLLTDFVSEILTAFSGVVSEVMVQSISEVLAADDLSDKFDEEL